MSKRGIRRASKRVRLAVAAAVLVGGGAAGVAVVTASHGASAVSSAGYSQQQSGQYMGYMDAMSQAMNNWNRSWTGSIGTISHMQQMTNVNISKWHHKIFVMQRGTVVKVGFGWILVRSADGHFETWHVSRGTKTVNVGGMSTGWNAMTGNTMQMPSWWNMNNMNTTVKGIAVNDLVFVFGQRERNVNKAELVLFAAQNTTTYTNTSNGTNNTFNGTNNTGTTPGGTNTTIINGQTAETGTSS